MAYLAPYWLLDPLTIMIREMHVVVVYQLALLRRSSMGTAGATTTCSSILASIDAETTLSIVDFPELASYHLHHKSFMFLSTLRATIVEPITFGQKVQIQEDCSLA